MKISKYAVVLQSVKAEDCERVWHWRNLAHVREQMTNQKPIAWEAHQQWYSKMLLDECQQHFVIHYKDKAIGVINVKADQPVVRAQCAEIGIYISDPQFLGNLIAFAPSLALIDHLFDKLSVVKLHSEVRRENTAAIRYNQQLGYKVTDHSTDRAFVNISLSHAEYQRATPKLKSFLNRG
jgi:RimJ/RimL family protein N-acetyltransferase